MENIAFSLNGQRVEAGVSGEERLLDLLRVKLGCTEVKEGCGEGECGACTVLLDGAPVNSCLLFAWQVHGRVVTTVRGLAREELERIGGALVREGAVQCGFCSPGFVLTIKALLDRGGARDRPGIMEALSGNLCRCTGYEAIARAVERLARSAGGEP